MLRPPRLVLLAVFSTAHAWSTLPFPVTKQEALEPASIMHPGYIAAKAVRAKTLMSSTTTSSAARPVNLMDECNVDLRIMCAGVDRLAALGSRCSDAYARVSNEHYLSCAFVQAGLLSGGADVTTQLMQDVDGVNVAHVLAMATVASTMSGVANAAWLRQLEDAFPGIGTQEVITKALFHAFVIASIINSAYLLGVPILTSFYVEGSPPTLASLSEGWTVESFMTLTKLELCMFVPYNLIAFRAIPVRVRPLTHAMVSATFGVAVSAITLGYFDAWCEGAATFFGWGHPAAIATSFLLA